MRHGNTFEEGQTAVQVGARTDLPLTAKGRQQALQMAHYLKSEGILPKRIFAGNLQRQKESAQLIAKELKLEVEILSALTEIDYGLWEGLTAREIERKWPKEQAEWSEKLQWPSHIFQGTFENHQTQLHLWLETLKKQYPNETILGVSSNGLLRFFRNEKVKTGHFCELHLQGNEVLIHRWNQSPSLDGFAEFSFTKP